jgi:hypothetical protein
VSVEAPARAYHRRIASPETGNALRITRWAEGARRRAVFRVLEEGPLVALGDVIQVGDHLCMAYPATAGLEPFACDSFVSGARALDVALDVVPLTIYTVQVRTTTLTEPDPHRIDADDTDMED